MPSEASGTCGSAGSTVHGWTIAGGDWFPRSGRRDWRFHVELAEVTRVMHSAVPRGSEEVLTTIASTAVEVVSSARCAAVAAVGNKNQLETVVGTTAEAVVIDRLQRLHGGGLPITAQGLARVVRVNDFSADERWPALRRAVVAESAIRSAVSYGLFTSEQTFGTLTLYSAATEAFSDEDVERGHAFAVHAAVVLDAARRLEQFRSALASRDVIGQAKGMLMERFDIGATQAFELLRKLSQDSNTPLADLARKLVDVDHP